MLGKLARRFRRDRPATATSTRRVAIALTLAALCAVAIGWPHESTAQVNCQLPPGAPTPIPCLPNASSPTGTEVIPAYQAGREVKFTAQQIGFFAFGAGGTIGSAATTDLGAVVQAGITVSGSATITSFGPTAPTGTIKYLLFSGTATLTYNSTSLIIPGGVSVTAAVDDFAVVEALGGGNWIVLAYVRATGQALVLPTGAQIIAQLGFTPLNKAGDTMTGELVTAAPTAGGAGFNLPPGTAPSSPANGDCWTTSAGLYCRVNGSTVGPYIQSSGAPVTSVFGRTGNVTAQSGDYSQSQITGGAIGTNIEAWSARLDALAGLSGVANEFPYFTGSTTMGLATVSAPLSFTGGALGLAYDSNFAVVGSNLALASIASGDVLGNSGASSAEPGPTTVTALLDRAIGSTSSDFLLRGATVWGLGAFGSEFSLSSSTVHIGSGGVASSMLASGAAASNLGSAGGDLTGTYPSPTIAANAVTNAKAAQGGANTIKGNPTGSTASEQDISIPSCPDSGGNHLNWVAGSGPTCGTSSGGAGAVLTKISTISPSSSAAFGWTGLTTYDIYEIDISALSCSSASTFLGLRFGTGGTPTYQTSSYDNMATGQNDAGSGGGFFNSNSSAYISLVNASAIASGTQFRATVRFGSATQNNTHSAWGHSIMINQGGTPSSLLVSGDDSGSLGGTISAVELIATVGSCSGALTLYGLAQ